MTRLKSDPFPVEIPEHIFRCMNECVLRVKKYFCNNELIVVKNEKCEEVISIPEEEKEDTQVQMKDLISEFGTMKSISEMLEYLKTVTGEIPSDTYARVYDILQSTASYDETEDENKEFTLNKLRLEFKNELFGDIPIEPIAIGENKIQCPCCGKVQQANRRRCYNCGIQFHVDI